MSDVYPRDMIGYGRNRPHRSLPSEVSQHVHDADRPIKGDAPCCSEFAERAFDFDTKLDHGHQREFAREFGDRREVLCKLRWEGLREFVLSYAHRLAGIPQSVFDDYLVAPLAQDDADGWLVIRVA
jgi:hypothetical protein